MRTWVMAAAMIVAAPAAAAPLSTIASNSSYGVASASAADGAPGFANFIGPTGGTANASSTGPAAAAVANGSADLATGAIHAFVSATGGAASAFTNVVWTDTIKLLTSPVDITQTNITVDVTGTEFGTASHNLSLTASVYYAPNPTDDYVNYGTYSTTITGFGSFNIPINVAGYFPVIRLTASMIMNASGEGVSDLSHTAIVSLQGPYASASGVFGGSNIGLFGPAPTPEPALAGLLGLGFLALAARRRRAA